VRAFHDTYGLEISDLFNNFDVAINSYRSVVSRTIPTATRIAWAQKRKEIRQGDPGESRKRFVYVMKRSSYQKEWGERYAEPSLTDKFLAFLLRLIPPIGPLKTLQFKMPTPQVENLFMTSFDRASMQYGKKLAALAAGNLVLPNENYDVGVATPVGVYLMDDAIQVFWLHKLAQKNFSTATPAIRAELLSYFGNLSAPMQIKKQPEGWKQFQSDYAALSQSE
jgi:hypothetical protein